MMSPLICLSKSDFLEFQLIVARAFAKNTVTGLVRSGDYCYRASDPSQSHRKSSGRCDTFVDIVNTAVAR